MFDQSSYDIASYAQRVQDHFGIPNFDGDAYVASMAGQSPEALTKSLTLGQSPMFVNPNMLGSGTAPTYGTPYADATALRLENMDSTLTSVLFQENHFVLFNWMHKIPTLGPLYQYNKRKSYGSSRGSSSFSEGAAPQSSVGSYERDNAVVRFMGTRRGVTHQLGQMGMMGGAIIDPVSEENRNGAMALLEKIERGLLWSDSMVPNNAGVLTSYDGLYKQIISQQPANVIDQQGSPMYFEQFEDIGYRLFNDAYVKNFTNVGAIMTGSVIADLGKLRYPNERQDVTTRIPQAGFDTGFTVGGHVTNFGRIPFQPSVLLEEVLGNRPLGLGETSAPDVVGAGYAGNGTATVSSGNTSAASVAASFNVQAVTDNNTSPASKVPAGTYYYWVSAFNESGESAPVAWGQTAPNTGSATAITVASGQSVAITVGVGTGMTVCGYRIYRSTSATPFQIYGTNNVVTDPTCGLIAHVPKPGVTGNTTGYYMNGVTTGAGATNYEMQYQAASVTWIDRNQMIPRSGICLVLERSEENMCIAQMTPLIKYPLAITSTTIEWLLLLYHVFVVKAPERQFIVKNISRLT